MNKLLLLLMFCATAIGNQAAAFQNIRIAGLASDILSGAKVPGVSFYTIIDNNRKLISSGDSEGRFKFDFPAGAKTLLIEKTGYRPMNTSIASYMNESANPSFFLRFSLIPLDKQGMDVPYMQSEQKQYTLNETTNEKKQVFRTFLVADALSGKAVTKGSLCFEFTKDGRKECKELGEVAKEEIKFTEPDIVGFTVLSAGYQTYSGNLILDKMDGSKGNYQVKLTPEITTLSLNVTGGTSPEMLCRLTSPEGREIVLPAVDKNAYFAFLSEGLYGLKVSDKSGTLVHAGQVSVGKGLNFLGVPARAIRTKKTEPVSQKPLPPAEAPRQLSPAFDTLQTTTIYFQQSDYILKPEEQNKLDALAAWLKTNLRQKIRIVGHTDNVGSPKLNIMLSEFRAKIIRNYLLTKSIQENQMLWTGVGGKYPVRKNDTEENKKMNRRVEITLLQ